MRLQVLAERKTLEELHDDEGPAGVFTNVEHRNDVRMPDFGGDPGLAIETLAGLGLVLHLGGNELQRHRLIRALVIGGEDVRHHAAADSLDEAVAPDERTDLDFDEPDGSHADCASKRTTSAVTLS